MYGFFMFLHISGFIFWLGTLISVAVILPIIDPYDYTEVEERLLSRLIHAINTIGHIAAVIVLISGLYQSTQINFGSGSKPFWVKYMEIAGGITLFLSVTVTIIMECRINKLLSETAQHVSIETTQMIRRIFTYHTIILLIILIALSIIIVTSFKL